MNIKRVLAFLAFAVVALAQSHSVTVAITDTANAGASYAVYRLTGACPSTPPSTSPPSGFTLLNTTPIAQTGSLTTYTDTTVVPGGQYCYNVVAIVGTSQASPSNDAGAVVPAAFPVSISVTVR
ncbi:MAG: hypothetical protein KGL39_26150 [Patescibacteria group bacterium]|nr:hypothetical protein [Patescibacteria group bacterium]